MSPLQIRILLHYYAIVGDYKGNTPDNFIHELGEMDMLERAYEKDRQWKLAERGLFYVKYLLSIPLPEQVFVIKQEKDDAFPK